VAERPYLKFVLFTLGLVFALFLADRALAQVTPSLQRLQLLLALPLSEDPEAGTNGPYGTTIAAAFATDLGTALKSVSTTQQITVTNTDTSGRICIGSVAWSGATSCSSLCGTAGSWSSQDRYDATMNCTQNDDSQGEVVPARQSRPFRYNGNRCICVVASEANTDGQISRVVY
jgi:hypothetical protein